MSSRLETSYASREAVALALAFSDDSGDSDEVADAILARYALGSRERVLVANLARLSDLLVGRRKSSGRSCTSSRCGRRRYE